MAYKMFGQSPSSVKTFLTCPRRFEGKYFLKEDPFIDSEASLYGTRFHTDSENYIGKRITPTPEFIHLKPTFDAVLAWNGTLMVEHSLSVDSTLRVPVPWRARRIGSKIDLLSIYKSTARIMDWKTGAQRDEYEDPLQLEVNALGVFAAYPDVNRILTNFAYTKTGRLGRGYAFVREPKHADAIDPESVSSIIPLEHSVGNLRHTLIRIENAHMSGVFPAQKNGLCRAHCPITSCRMNGKYKGA